MFPLKFVSLISSNTNVDSGSTYMFIEKLCYIRQSFRENFCQPNYSTKKSLKIVRKFNTKNLKISCEQTLKNRFVDCECNTYSIVYTKQFLRSTLPMLKQHGSSKLLLPCTANYVFLFFPCLNSYGNTETYPILLLLIAIANHNNQITVFSF